MYEREYRVFEKSSSLNLKELRGCFSCCVCKGDSLSWDE